MKSPFLLAKSHEITIFHIGKSHGISPIRSTPVVPTSRSSSPISFSVTGADVDPLAAEANQSLVDAGAWKVRNSEFSPTQNQGEYMVWVPLI
jgi:hypothetical protein